MSSQVKSDDEEVTAENEVQKISDAPFSMEDMRDASAAPGEVKLPVFDYVPDRASPHKFKLYKERLMIYFGSKYNHGDMFIRNEAYYEMPKFLEFTSTQIGKKELRDRANQKAVDAYVASIHKYNEDKSKIYSELYGRCTIAMRHKLSEYEEFEEAYKNKDCLALWLLMKKAMTAGADMGDSLMRSAIAEDRFHKLKQDSNEPTTIFYERFVTELEGYLSAGGSVLDGKFLEVCDGESTAARKIRVDSAREKKKAMMFLQRLDPRRYGPMLRELEHARNAGVDLYPADVLSAMRMANRRKDTNSREFAESRAVKKSESGGVVAFTAVESGEVEVATTQQKRHSMKRDSMADSERGSKGNSSGKQDKGKSCYYCGKPDHRIWGCKLLTTKEKHLFMAKRCDGNVAETRVSDDIGVVNKKESVLAVYDDLDDLPMCGY